ncbi:hypothetical protein V8E54_012853 [Elaphomyces granulatus]
MLMYSTESGLFLSLLSLPQLIASLSHIQPEPTDSSLHDFQSDGWTPKPTSAPDLFIQKRQSSGYNYSNYTYTCQAGEACLSNNYWWGCCYQTLGGGEWECLSVSSCVGYEQLSLCDQDCEAATDILKCNDTNSPYCAVATAVSNTALPSNVIYISPPMTTGQKLFACEPSPYNLNFSVSASMIEPSTGAIPFAINPTSLSTAHCFGDPFKGVVARNGTNTTMTTSMGCLNALGFPTTTSASSSTTSGGAEVVVPPHRMIIYGFALALAFVF